MARGRPPATHESSRVTGAAGGRRPRARPAAAREASGVAGRRESGAAARESGPRSRVRILCKKLDRYFYFNCKCCEPLDVLGRWMKGRKLRCDLLQLSY